MTPTAYGAICSAKPGEIIAAAVGIGIPEENTFGVIMECSAICSKADLERKMNLMVMAGLKTRHLTIQEIKIRAVEHQVSNCGCAFAEVALWY